MAFDRSGSVQQDSAAKLCGLVLAGGGSRRMGTDKGQLMYSGQPQVTAALQIVEHFCADAYVSLNRPRPAYRELPVIIDVTPDSGPAGALLSAWQLYPDVAWLSVAVDMPLLDVETLSVLVESRDASKLATAFKHSDGIIEPLCTIWEPLAQASVRDEMNHHRGSLRRVLEESDTQLIDPPQPSKLESVDELSRYRILRDRLAKHTPEKDLEP